MSNASRFSLRSAITDSVSTGRREEPISSTEMVSALDAMPASETATTALQSRRSTKGSKTVRPATRQGARGVTTWVEPEIYRAIKLVALDRDMTTQDVMMEAINDLLAKRGKGRIAKTR